MNAERAEARELIPGPRSSARPNAATDPHPTAALDLELATLNAAFWGGEVHLFLDELAVAEFVDPWCRDARDVLVRLQRDAEQDIVAGGKVDPFDVAAELKQMGWLPILSRSVVLAEVAPGTLHALGSLLTQMAEVAERRRVLARLVALADTLERPGGAARVAEVLGVAL